MPASLDLEALQKKIDKHAELGDTLATTSIAPFHPSEDSDRPVSDEQYKAWLKEFSNLLGRVEAHPHGKVLKTFRLRMVAQQVEHGKAAWLGPPGNKADSTQTTSASEQTAQASTDKPASESDEGPKSPKSESDNSDHSGVFPFSSPLRN